MHGCVVALQFSQRLFEECGLIVLRKQIEYFDLRFECFDPEYFFSIAPSLRKQMLA